MVNQAATIYDEAYFTKSVYQGYRDYDAHKQRVEKIISLAHPQRVLDAGCAYGFIVRRLLDKGIYAVGMDVSEWAGKMAKDIIPHNFVCHDMRKTPYPFRDKEFDVVYCEGVLEHIEEEYIAGIMREFARIGHETIIQVAFECHQGAKDTPGHLTLHDNGWWMSVIPDGTWLAWQECDTGNCQVWLYKG